MYNFIDVTATSEGTFLPSEALKINGKYIENQIPGYKTLAVAGREALAPEVYTFETGVRDGSMLSSKRYPARRITVKYQLIAESNEAFRAAYNALGGILDVIDAELIFNDEPDKFFIGTPSHIDDVEPGRNAVVGQFEILCLDPFKYSIAEYEAKPAADESGIAIAYKGTYKSFPTLVAEFYKEEDVSADGRSTVALTGNGDCGFVAFYNDRAKIIQFGNADEIDTEDVPMSETLMNQTFLTDVSWGTGAKSLWTVNSGVPVPAQPQQIGTVGMKESGEPAATYTGTHYMTPTSYGSADGIWHGPTITRTLGADKDGNVGATDFLVSFRHKMSIGRTKSATGQYGRFSLSLLDANNNIVMSADIHKYKAGKTAAIAFYVGGERVKGVEIDLSYENKYLGNGAVTSWMRKTGPEFVFNMAGHRYSFINSELVDRAVTKVVVAFAQYSTMPTLTHNGLFWVKFRKDNFADVPNQFNANDVLEADCRTGEILLNGTASPDLGALGNDWEEFYLTPGLNQIDATYSNWLSTEYAPDIKVRYREVFL